MTPVSCRFLVGLGLAATASLASSQSVRNDPLAPLPPGAERAVPQPIAPPPRMAPADLRESVNALGRRFNGILAWDSFFHLSPDDQRRMFPVFRIHAAPKAALMFTSGPAHGVAIGSFEGEPLYHASLDEAQYRALLAENGFAVVSHAVEDPTCGGHTIWLAQLT